MDIHSWLMQCLVYGVTVGLPAWFVWWLFNAYRKAAALELQRLHQRNAPLFQQALAEHAIETVEVLRDNTDIGSTGTGNVAGGYPQPFQVHMILHSPPKRWFVYIHIEGSRPVLTEISEQRAVAAVNS